MEGSQHVSRRIFVPKPNERLGPRRVRVRSDEYHPLSNRMRKLYIVYWSNEEDEAIHIFNLGGAPAAAAKIAVYEILNDLPAVKTLRRRRTPDRVSHERGAMTMSATYYAGPLGQWLSWGWAALDHPEFYRDWMIATENMIKAHAFRGTEPLSHGPFHV